MKALLFFAFVAPLIVQIARCQELPIPNRYEGMKIGNPAAPILLEEFLDLQCIKCQAAHPTIKQVLAHYGPDKIYYIQHINPLDLHRQAWDAAKSAAVVNKYTPQHYWDYIDYMFANQNQYYDAAWFNKTEAQLYDLFATWGEQYNIKKQLFVKEMSSDYAFSVADMGRLFSVTRGVHFTPTFYVNGVKATQVDSTTTVQQWIQFLDPLISGGN
jgi:protein-disulfide isomerase